MNNHDLRELWRIKDPYNHCCPFCGLMYVQDSPTDCAEHRRFHRQHASTLPPRPDKRITALQLPADRL
jgi:hypothetical protein